MTCSASVLVAEDDADIRETLQLILESEGYRVLAARDGREALELLGKSGPVCIVLLDLMMPDVDGWEVYAAMSEDPQLRDIPVCVVSATPELAPTKIAHVVRKPVDLDRLLKIVEERCKAA